MENFDVVQALARSALAGTGSSVEHQIERLAERLADGGDSTAARKLRTMVTRSRSRQAVEPLNFSPSGRSVPVDPSTARLGPSTALPVDRETGAPLGEAVFSNYGAPLPILPPQAASAYNSLVSEWECQEKLASYGLPVSRSLLIFGPPGTGKTSLALAISATLGKPAVVARLDGIISSLLGSTARNLGNLFDFCNRYDCVLILDEFDAVAKIRDDTNEIGEIKRVVNTLLQNIDKRSTKGLTIAVTNHQHLLDSAVWRRFEHQIGLGLPDFDARVAIAMQHLSVSEHPKVFARALAATTASASGADVRTLAVAAEKRSVLATVKPSYVDALRQASTATGLQVVPQLHGADSELARWLQQAPASLTIGDLAILFARDRKTIGRWLSSV